MKRIRWRDSFALWWEEPSSKLIVGLFLAMLVAVGLFAVGIEPKPLAARYGLGPSWGARWQPPKKSN
jgi:F0F1-type ATP synthase membrane subunit a